MYVLLYDSLGGSFEKNNDFLAYVKFQSIITDLQNCELDPLLDPLFFRPTKGKKTYKDESIMHILSYMFI